MLKQYYHKINSIASDRQKKNTRKIMNFHRGKQNPSREREWILHN